MIGIVVVSHSPSLANAVVELALEMVRGERPMIAIAAGTGDGMTGTDAVRVADAITKVQGPDGVLVFTDLGSAVLSAEMSLEFLEKSTTPVKLTSAPFVEGIIAAVVLAAAGASLDEVETEARSALLSKQSQLGDDVGDDVGRKVGGEASTAGRTAGSTAGITEGITEASVTLINAVGLHARPVAMLINAVRPLQARVMIANRRTGKPAVPVAGPTALLALDGRNGDVLELAASGPQADAAIAAIRTLVESGFGEMDAAPSDAAKYDSVAPAAQPHRPGPIGVSPGRASGPVVQMPAPVAMPEAGATIATDARQAESARVTDAAASVESSLLAMAERTSGTAREVLETTAMMAVDPGLIDGARDRITSDGVSAPEAVWAAAGAIAEELASNNGLIAERAADVRDVRDRVIAALTGAAPPGVPDRSEPFVLVARDLAPADTALLDPSKILAIVTAEGGPTSHTAILARALGIPAIVSAPAALDISDGTIIFIDGSTGELVLDPGPELVASVGDSADEVPVFSGKGQTADGLAIDLLANVGSPASVTEAVKAQAQGVGLFRTEFCFLDRTSAPTIDEQVAAYRPVFAAFPDRKVIVRTLDAGADKPLPFVTAAHEDNPALGIRGFRTSWRRPEVLADQLAAIAIASAAERANVGVMAPMISTREEAAEFRGLCASKGIDVVGVMIETPSAAITAAEIFAEVSFASLGTNDLAQYTMAADRLDGELAELNDTWQPAVLRMISAACLAATAAGKPIGVCGEAAADPVLAVVLVGLGATSLSMSPRAIARVAAALVLVTAQQCRAAAALAIAAPDAAAARLAVTHVLATR